jgi:hypothetical protein
VCGVVLCGVYSMVRMYWCGVVVCMYYGVYTVWYVCTGVVVCRLLCTSASAIVDL